MIKYNILLGVNDDGQVKSAHLVQKLPTISDVQELVTSEGLSPRVLDLELGNLDSGEVANYDAIIEACIDLGFVLDSSEIADALMALFMLGVKVGQEGT